MWLEAPPLRRAVALSLAPCALAFGVAAAVLGPTRAASAAVVGIPEMRAQQSAKVRIAPMIVATLAFLAMATCWSIAFATWAVR